MADTGLGLRDGPLNSALFKRRPAQDSRDLVSHCLRKPGLIPGNLGSLALIRELYPSVNLKAIER